MFRFGPLITKIFMTPLLIFVSLAPTQIVVLYIGKLGILPSLSYLVLEAYHIGGKAEGLVYSL